MKRPPALAALALATLLAPAAAYAGDVQVVNERGIPQAALWTDGDGAPSRPTDVDGRITGLDAGTRVRVTRSTSTSPCFRNQGGAPEGAAGLAIEVPAEGTATLVVPNATGDAFAPENSDAERWIAGKINERRAERGLPPVRISAILGRAASAVARQQATRGLSFPPPFCPVVLADWGFPGRAAYTHAALDAGGTDPRAAWEHWSDGSIRERSGTLGENWDAVGIGDGGGAWAAYFADCPADLDARCEMTADQGDASIVLPAPPASGGDGGGGGGGGGKPPADPAKPPASGTPPAVGEEPAKALRGLTVKRRQRGKAVKATVDVGQAGSAVVARLWRGKRVVGKARASSVPAGRRTLRIKLSRAGRRTLIARGTLRVTVEMAVDPPAGERQTLRRPVTLKR